MKALLYSQLNPCKTMEQLIDDRDLYRFFLVAALFMSWCC